MKNNLDLIESKLNSLNRFATNLSQRTQETDLLEHLQQLQTFIQRLKSLLKDLFRRAADGQTKYSLYSQQPQIYKQLLNECEQWLNDIWMDIETWNQKPILLNIIQTTSNTLQSLINTQSTIQQQNHLFNEVMKSLLDSVENANFR